MAYENPFGTSFHGGNCCLISHIYGFWDPEEPSNENLPPPEIRTEMVKETMNDCFENNLERNWWKDNGESHVIEVCLITRQRAAISTLKEIGFKEIARYKNGNSSNTVVIYHYPMKKTFDD